MTRDQGVLTRRRFLQGAAATLALGCEARSTGPSSRPSFLVLVTDDQRADTLGCMGNAAIRTPAIDALAAEGVLFDRAFVTTSACPCSRASIFSGQYMRRHGVRDFKTPLGVSSLADSYPLRLREAGYRTGFLGKWGLGGPLPWSAFDSFEGFSGQGRYWEGKGGEGEHLTRVLASQAIAFLEEADPRPFCLSLSFKAPHGPWFFDPAFAPLYRDEELPVAPTVSLDAVQALSDFMRNSMVGNRGFEWLAEPASLQRKLRAYYRMISGVDAAVGRILEAVDRLGLADRLIVLFTSDNGLMIGEHGFVGKALMHEESIRVPLILRDASRSSDLVGRRLDEMALNIDIAPTLLDLAGLPIPASMQGQSLAPLLRNESVQWREDWFYEFEMKTGWGYFPRVEGVRSKDWKYVHYLDDEIAHEELYDLGRDPMEAQDLAGHAAHRDTLERLRGRWQGYRSELA